MLYIFFLNTLKVLICLISIIIRFYRNLIFIRLIQDIKLDKSASIITLTHQ